MEITLNIYTIIYILIEVITFVWACTRDNSSGGLFFSARELALMVWFIISVIVFLIIGGIFWW